MKLARHLSALLAAGLCAAAMTPARAACLNGNPSVKQELMESSIVVVGHSMESHLIPDPEDPEGYAETIYVVKVTEVLKGPAPATFRIHSVNTSSRYPMDTGVPNLLFVRLDADEQNFVDNCGNSNLLKRSGAAYEAVKRAMKTSAVIQP